MTARAAWGAWPGRAALGCALLVAGWDLGFKRLFLHLGLPAEPMGSAGLGEAGIGVLVLAGTWLAVRALRRGARPGALAAGSALVLLAPFLADALLALPARAIDSLAARRATFFALCELIALLALIATVRALRRTPPAPPSPRALAARRLAARVSLALVATAVALAAAELGLRAAGVGARPWSGPMLIIPGDDHRIPLNELGLYSEVKPPPAGRFTSYYRACTFFKGWYDEPRRAYVDEQGHIDYVFNRYGLRDDDFELDKPVGELRILAVGDSFTFGAGVTMEDAWPQVLERELHARLARPVQVVNAGASGSDPGLDEPWIVNQGLRLQPDVMVVALNLNDMSVDVPMLAWESPPPPRPWWGARSNLLNALQRTLGPPPGEPVLVDVEAVVRGAPEMWQRTQAALRRESEACRARGVRFVVAPVPMLSGLREPRWPYAGLMQQVQDFCAAEGFETVDVSSQFLGRVDQELWVHPMDQHPNEIAQRLIAEKLADALAPR